MHKDAFYALRDAIITAENTLSPFLITGSWSSNPSRRISLPGAQRLARGYLWRPLSPLLGVQNVSMSDRRESLHQLVAQLGCEMRVSSRRVILQKLLNSLRPSTSDVSTH